MSLPRNQLPSVNSSHCGDDVQLWIALDSKAAASGQLTLRWKDQGFGNHKGRIHARSNGGQWVCLTKDPAAHDWETLDISLPPAVLGGQKLELGYVVGGGGGHSLTVSDASLSFKAGAGGADTSSLALGAGKVPLIAELNDTQNACLQKATRDLMETMTGDLTSKPERARAVQSLCGMLLDLEYVGSSKAAGGKTEVSIKNEDPMGKDSKKMLQYIKLMADKQLPPLPPSNVCGLLVQMAMASALDGVGNCAPGTDRYKHAMLYQHVAWEACPEMAGKLLVGKNTDYTAKKDWSGPDTVAGKPIVNPPGFTGFCAKPPSSMVNKLYCRRGKNKTNIYADRIRARLEVGSREEVKKLYDLFRGKSFFHHKLGDDKVAKADSREIFLLHMELMSKILAKDESADQFVFKNKQRVPWFDCGPWDHTNLIIYRVKYNAVCDTLGMPGEIFNLNYYINCPQTQQTVEGFTLFANEIQIGTKKAMDAIEANHKMYDRMRVIECNKGMVSFLDGMSGAVKSLIASAIEYLFQGKQSGDKGEARIDALAALSKISEADWAKISYSKELEHELLAHHKSFAQLALVMDESNLKREAKGGKSGTIKRITASDKSETVIKNYTGRYGGDNRNGIVWQHVNTEGNKLRALKLCKIWASNGGCSDGGHSQVGLYGFIGDYAHEIAMNAVGPSSSLYTFVDNYRMAVGPMSGVLLGDLSKYDKVVLCVRSATYPGWVAVGHGFEVEFIAS